MHIHNPAAYIFMSTRLAEQLPPLERWNIRRSLPFYVLVCGDGWGRFSEEMMYSCVSGRIMADEASLQLCGRLRRGSSRLYFPLKSQRLVFEGEK